MAEIKGVTKMPDDDLKELWTEIQDACSGMRYLALVKTALDSGTFEYLQMRHTSSEVAEAIGIKKELADFYCDSLVRIGFIQKCGEFYCNSDRTNSYLTSSSELDQRARAEEELKTIMKWADLLNILQKGPSDTDAFDAVYWIETIAQRSLNGQICKLNDIFSSVIDLDKCRSFLDIGGGHGLYSIGLKLAYPHISCTIFDRPEIIKVAEKYAENYDAELTYLAGDFEKDFIPGSYDLIYSSFTPFGSEEKYIKKALNLLNKGGYFAIRRHKRETSEDPIMNLEWNFKNIPDYRLGRKRWEFDADKSVKKYLDALTDSGMNVILHRSFDSLSEIIIAKREI